MQGPEGELAGIVAVWDAHVDRCRVCLTDGMTLCNEGQLLTREVAKIRAAGVSSGTSDGPVRPFHGPQPTSIPTQVAA